ncbi:unnamed protein product [Onchocerca flexuosa]|uniref:Activin_recp domain-containing protein n=1 Tax=Onchocerca flexuosa TaxID=387005 RepID=A0A183H0U6_9BILA|nr:unnamed protein product [Onchocerca flexuosa]
MSFLVFILSITVAVAVKNNSDPGYDILKFMEQFQANLRDPINLSEELICNCSYSGCDTEIVRFLGSTYTGLCRSTSGICYKRLLPDRSIILSCLSKDASPDLHCRVKQPMNDGSMMQCCWNYSFCNGALDLNLVNDYSSVRFHSILLFIRFLCSLFSIIEAVMYIVKSSVNTLFDYRDIKSS